MSTPEHDPTRHHERDETAAEASRLAAEVLDQVERAVVGKRDALVMVLAGILAGGHVLIEDLPGLGKTLAARSFAQTLGLRFTRAQFTPDLLPADLTGSFVYDQKRSEFDFRPGAWTSWWWTACPTTSTWPATTNGPRWPGGCGCSSARRC